MRAAALAILLLVAGPVQAGKLHLGADVSSLPCVEAGGAVFTDAAGRADALTILARHDVDRVRIRLWHTPPDGRSGLEEAVALAVRARDLGLGVLLDLHYSDTWADPGHQAPPAAWRGLAPEVLEDSVRISTRDVLRRFAAAGAAPAWIQLGNEISAGLLWDTGRVDGAFDTPAQWDRLAALLNAAV
ncbi:MAG TPA: glycosyl hydrolase 53 family protein, partial [Candidatus Krumholzibacteria bacterium]|nr:glycosyl hydrolase 53 family protein [Candidatus Krumholzibacteria bacterium]